MSVASLAFAAIIGFSLGDSVGRPPQAGDGAVATDAVRGTSNYVRPSTMRELLATTHLVAEVTFVEKTDETWELPYDYEEVRADIRSRLGDAAVPEIPPIPVTYYEVRVDDLIYDEYGLAVGDTVELRLPGRDDDGILQPFYPAPRIGDRQLMVMGQNRDGSSAPITIFHAFDLASSDVRHVAQLDDGPVPTFSAAKTRGAFLGEIRAELTRRGPSPVPPVDIDNLVPRPIAPPPTTQ